MKYSETEIHVWLSPTKRRRHLSGVPGSKKETKKLLMTFLYRLSFYPKVTRVLGIHFIF